MEILAKFLIFLDMVLFVRNILKNIKKKIKNISDWVEIKLMHNFFKIKAELRG